MSPTRRFHAEVLTDLEVRALLDAPRGHPALRARARALIALLYRSGLRLGEALSLRPHDIDPNAGSIRVLFAKGSHPRTVGVDPGALRLLDEWLRHREALRPPPSAPLFCSRSGRPVAAATIRRMLPTLARRAGVAKRVHAHGLRHTHAAQLRAEGVDIAVISRQLGHRSILTTIHYLDHLAPTAVLKALNARHWPAT